MTFKRAILKQFLILASLFSVAHGLTPRPVDQAFQLVTQQTATGVKITWHIAPGYHLYKDRIRIRLQPQKAGQLQSWQWPVGQMIDDAAFGRTEVYANRLNLTIPIKVTHPGPATLIVRYQGCADKFCYPPVAKQVSLDLPRQVTALNTPTTQPQTTTAPAPVAKPLSPAPTGLHNQGRAARILSSHRWWVIIVSFFGFGLLLSLTPCVLPMVPILSGIIVGHGHNISAGKAFRLSLTYVVCVALTYSVAGMLVALAGSRLTATLQAPPVIILFSLLFIVLACALFGLYELKLPQTWQQKIQSWHGGLRGGDYLSVAIMGILSALIVSPCVTAPLVGALAYISQTGDVVLGGVALFCLGLGMGAPLILIGTGSRRFLPKAGRWMKVVQVLLGILLVIVAMSLLSRVVHLPSLLPTASINHQELSFKKVKSYSDLRKVLHDVGSDKPVMLDFYADWCVACKKMEQNVYPDASVQRLMQQFVLLKADVTANDATDKALMNRLKVIAPPTWIFFHPQSDGQATHQSKQTLGEMRRMRIVGEMDPKLFARALARVLQRHSASH